MPDRSQFSLDSDADFSASGATDETSNSSIPENSKVLLPASSQHFGSNSTGTSANPVNAGGGSSVFALRSVAAILISDQSVSSWLTAERRLTLPIPPANSLLRPPQESLVVNA